MFSQHDLSFLDDVIPEKDKKKKEDEKKKKKRSSVDSDVEDVSGLILEKQGRGSVSQPESAFTVCEVMMWSCISVIFSWREIRKALEYQFILIQHFECFSLRCWLK